MPTKKRVQKPRRAHRRIDGLRSDRGSGTINWQCDGQGVSVTEPEVEIAFVDDARNMVLALTTVQNGHPQWLHGFACSGERRFRVGPPPGCQFSYLTAYPEVGAVVCDCQPEIDGWPQWHFAIDEHTGALKRYHPAY